MNGRPVLPDYVFVHEVVIAPFLGRNATGALYGDEVTYRCLIVEGRRLSRASGARQDTDTTHLYFQVGTDIPLESRAVVRGRPLTVTSVSHRDTEGQLPTPDHVMAVVQ